MIRRHALVVLLLLFVVSCRQKEEPSEAKAVEIRNIILISIDTLRPDALSIYGGKTRTPFFEEFAKRAVVFDHAYTSAPITLPAHTSLMTGLYPPSHGVRHNGVFKAGANLPLIAQTAKENGYRTAAFVGGFPLASKFGLNQGFETYDDHFHYGGTKPGVFEYAERSADEVRSAAERWISEAPSTPQPFFLWLHFFDPHHPYFEHGFVNMSPYQQEVLYVDQQLQKLFAFLTDKKLNANSLIIITADHGEAFEEHREVSHSLFVYNTTLHIPLLISAPRISASRKSELVRIVDIAPTIIELKNWKMPANLDGASLMPIVGGKSDSRWSYSESLAPAIDFGWSPLFCIQNSQAKYIQAPKAEFYDLQKDPAENDNLIASARVDEYAKRLREILNRRSASNQTLVLSPEEKERLRSLGYFATSPGKLNPNAPDPKDRVEVARKIAALTLDPASPETKVKEYQEIVKLEPANSLLNLRYAEILLQLKRYKDAEKIFRHVMQLRYPGASVYNGLSAALYLQDRTEEAEKILRKAILDGEADAETFYNMAEFQFQKGNREEAFRNYDRSIKLKYLPAFVRKARLKALLGDSDEALRILGEAEENEPDNAQINHERAMIYFTRAKYPEAIVEFEKSLQKDPESIDLIYNIGVSYYRMHDAAKAKQYLQEFLKRSNETSKQQREIARKILAELQ